jgi:signal peptidase II
MKKKIIFKSIIFLIIDIISKILIDNFLTLSKSITIIKNFFNITKVYNYGASWSILSGYRFILIIISFAVLFILYNYQQKFKNNKRNIVAFSLLYGGITGNLLNRLFLGYVIDFLDFKIFSYDYPIFNFADAFIVIGTILLIIAIIKKEDNNEISSK